MPMPAKPLPTIAMRGATARVDAADEAGVTAISGKDVRAVSSFRKRGVAANRRPLERYAQGRQLCTSRQDRLEYVY
jgi:hypothetical protein